MDDVAAMREAIGEARKALGRTHPNPAVGAIILQQGKIVARGHTQPAGSDHAEIVALKAYRAAGLQPDATTALVVTLEPCSTCGRTGACTDAILAAGIPTLVAGATDPNPAHAGRGFEVLQSAGVAVRSGVLEADCRDLNLIFNWRMERGIPLFAGKVATTLDGRIATRGGQSKWITGPESRADVHAWRRYFPAIAVGAGTVLMDDPALTIREEGSGEVCPGHRFIFDRSLISLGKGQRRIYSDAWRKQTVIITSSSRRQEAERLQAAHGLTFWVLDADPEDGGLAEFSQRCAEAGIWGVYVEGGAHLLSSFLRQRWLHYLFAYRAPLLLADPSGLSPFMAFEPVNMSDSVHLHCVQHAVFGDDQLMRGFVVYPKA